MNTYHFHRFLSMCPVPIILNMTFHLFYCELLSAAVLFRYPVILEQFSLRPNSGGEGQFCGGDGVIRKLLFRNTVVLSVLTERRSFCPYGIKGKNIFFKLIIFTEVTHFFAKQIFGWWCTLAKSSLDRLKPPVAPNGISSMTLKQ